MRKRKKPTKQRSVRRAKITSFDSTLQHFWKPQTADHKPTFHTADILKTSYQSAPCDFLSNKTKTASPVPAAMADTSPPAAAVAPAAAAVAAAALEDEPHPRPRMHA